MPDNVTPERTQLLQMYGAEIVYSPGDQGSNGAVAMALEMAEADASYYMPYQYGNPANPNAHYYGTAPRDHRGARRGDRVRRRPRHRRHADGQRAPAARGVRRRGEDRRRRADAGRARAGPALARRRLHPADHRPLAARPEDLRHATTTRSSGRAGCSTRRASSPASRPARSPRSPCGSRTSSTRATSSSSSATTAGSTSPRASTRARWRRSRTWIPPSGGERLSRRGFLGAAGGARAWARRAAGSTRRARSRRRTPRCSPGCSPPSWRAGRAGRRTPRGRADRPPGRARTRAGWPRAAGAAGGRAAGGDARACATRWRASRRRCSPTSTRCRSSRTPTTRVLGHADRRRRRRSTLAALRLAARRAARARRVRGLHVSAAVTAIAAAVAERYAGARTDSGPAQGRRSGSSRSPRSPTRAAAAARSPARPRAWRCAFAGHEREHAAVFETLLFALTVPVREHATAADVDGAGPRAAAAGARRGARRAGGARGRGDRRPPADRPAARGARRAALGGHRDGRRRPAPGGAPPGARRRSPSEGFRKRPLSRYPAVEPSRRDAEAPCHSTSVRSSS